MCDMLVELHQVGIKTSRITVNVQERPTKIIVEPSGNELFLDWDATVDDSDRLRCCLICRKDLYRERAFPQITGIVVVLAFAGGVAGVLGYLTTWSMLSAMVLVLLLDIAILVFDRPRLVCYGCGTVFRNTAIAPHFIGWDKQRAEQILRARD